MKTLPAELILEKNKTETNSAWLILLEIVLTDTTLYLVRNTEDIVFSGQTYTAFPFEIDPIVSASKGEIPTLIVKVSNITRVIQGYIEQYDGAVGQEAILRIVNSENLSSDYAEFEMVFTIQKTEADENYVSLTLGPSNPLRRRFPLQKYIVDSCNFIFKSEECAYTGVDTTCKRSYADCSSKGNTLRFGGHKGLSSGGVRLV